MFSLSELTRIQSLAALDGYLRGHLYGAPWSCISNRTGGQIYLYRDGGRIQNCLLEVYWTNSCWFRVGLRICLAPRHPSVWRVRLSALVVNSALFMMCVINLANIRYGCPGTSRRSLVSSLSTIPEIINVLLTLRILLKIEGVWKVGRNDTCDTMEYMRLYRRKF